MFELSVIAWACAVVIPVLFELVAIAVACAGVILVIFDMAVVFVDILFVLFVIKVSISSVSKLFNPFMLGWLKLIIYIYTYFFKK